MTFELSSSLGISLGIAGLYLAIVFIVAEKLNQLTIAEAEITRKVVHIGAGNVILIAWWLNIPRWVGISASVVASTIALTSYFIPFLPSINSIGRKSLGTFFYAISIGVLVSWFWPLEQPQYAAIGILVMAWGDGMAALIGQRFGKHRYQVLGMSKSLEGSATMAGVSFLVTGLILYATQGNIISTWWISLVVAAIATLLESFSKLGFDNLTVPIGSATVTYFLVQSVLIS